MPDQASILAQDALIAAEQPLTPKDEEAINATSPEPQPEDALPPVVGEGAQRTVQKWIDDAAAFAHGAIDKAASTARPLALKASAAVSGSGASSEADSWLNEARNTVRSHPFAAVGVAALAGVVLSLLLSSDNTPDPQ